MRGMADNAYSSKANQACLRDRGIQCVIPEKEDQKDNRKRKGSAGGRPVSYDKVAYKRRNVFERSYNTLKQWRSLTTRVRLARSRLPNSRRTTSRRQLESRHHRRSP